eukprot:Em0001g1004a
MAKHLKIGVAVHAVDGPSSWNGTSDSRMKLNYGDAEETLSELRTRCWIVQGQSFIRRILHNCLVYKMEGRHYSIPPSPPLPEFRVQQAQPFLSCGVDYTGPLNLKDTSKNTLLQHAFDLNYNEKDPWWRLLPLPEHIEDQSDPDFSLTSTTLAITQLMRHMKLVLEHFWKRWLNEYLKELRDVHHYAKQPQGSGYVGVGDMVLVHDADHSRCFGLGW